MIRMRRRGDYQVTICLYVRLAVQTITGVDMEISGLNLVHVFLGAMRTLLLRMNDYVENYLKNSYRWYRRAFMNRFRNWTMGVAPPYSKWNPHNQERLAHFPSNFEAYYYFDTFILKCRKMQNRRILVLIFSLYSIHNEVVVTKLCKNSIFKVCYLTS